MKKRILVVIIIVMALICALTACSTLNEETENSPEVVGETSFGFEVVSSQQYRDWEGRPTYNIIILREKSTDLLYIETATGFEQHGYGLTVMLNPETGNPLTYSDWVKNYKK